MIWQSMIVCYPAKKKKMRALGRLPWYNSQYQNICYLILANGSIEIWDTHGVELQYTIEMLYIIAIGFLLPLNQFS